MDPATSSPISTDLFKSTEGAPQTAAPALPQGLTQDKMLFVISKLSKEQYNTTLIQIASIAIVYSYTVYLYLLKYRKYTKSKSLLYTFIANMIVALPLYILNSNVTFNVVYYGLKYWYAVLAGLVALHYYLFYTEQAKQKLQ